jgi:antitoxin ParD1/3/4
MPAGVFFCEGGQTMAIRSFELTPEVDNFIAGAIERGTFKDASELVCAAVRALERDQEDDHWKMFAIEQALAEGDASGIAEGDVFEQIRTARKLKREEQVVLG